jgi:hypothetical protein
MRVPIRCSGFVTVKRDVQLRIAKCEAENLCYACKQPLIDGEVVVRHDHERCYRALKRAIDRGETTDEECVEKGLMASQGTPGRKPNHIALKDLRT